MMNRVDRTFSVLEKMRRPAFCAGEVLGHPAPGEFMRRVKQMLRAEPDILEFSIPFSDPVADGPTIQAAHMKALRAGVTPRSSLQLVAKLRRLTEVPIFLIVYSNLIFKYGIEKFYRDLKRAGGDCVLLPDVPPEEIGPFASAAKRNRIHQILIVSEHTSAARVRRIAKLSSGFLYVVTAPGVTGTRTDLNKKVFSLIKKLKGLTKLPLMLGFGISTPEHIRDLKKAHADAVVVCSAIVKTPTNRLRKFVAELKRACGH